MTFLIVTDIKDNNVLSEFQFCCSVDILYKFDVSCLINFVPFPWQL